MPSSSTASSDASKTPPRPRLHSRPVLWTALACAHRALTLVVIRGILGVLW